MKILRAKRHLFVVHHEFDTISSNNDYGKYLEHFKYKHDIRFKAKHQNNLCKRFSCSVIKLTLNIELQSSTADVSKSVIGVTNVNTRMMTSYSSVGNG